MSTGARDATYVMGETDAERERLARQAQMYDGYLRHLLEDAGLSAGMRVLDVGCGAGDVALVAAGLVGPSGSVVGVDRDPATVAKARGRAAERGLDNVSFVEGDFRTVDLDGAFDAAIGRFVLMYQGDPSAAIRAASDRVRPGGIVAFQEADWTVLPMYPAVDLWWQVREWWYQTAQRAGLELHMGVKLPAAFRRAGLPVDRVHFDTLIGGGPDFPGYDYVTDVMRSILPLMEQFGVATAAEVDVETLAQRIRDEVVAKDAVVGLQGLGGVWVRKP
jgi:SAM-dependent methyltransferase